ncbi:MAG: SycD/LcrH family type III secretion system chaperone [Aeromonas jandaei]
MIPLDAPIPSPAAASSTEQADVIAARCLDILEGRITPADACGSAPAELEALYERAYHAWNRGECDEATELFAFLALQQPLDRRFPFAFACALKEQGEYRHALTLFSQTLAMQANDPFAPFHIAECLQALGETDAARDALDAVIALCFGQAEQDPRYDALRQRAEIQLASLNH